MRDALRVMLSANCMKKSIFAILVGRYLLLFFVLFMEVLAHSDIRRTSQI